MVPIMPSFRRFTNPSVKVLFESSRNVISVRRFPKYGNFGPTTVMKLIKIEIFLGYLEQLGTVGRCCSCARVLTPNCARANRAKAKARRAAKWNATVSRAHC